MVVADHDHTAATDLALKAYERALEPKRLVMIKGGHFDPYLSGFETASGAAIDWFETTSEISQAATSFSYTRARRRRRGQERGARDLRPFCVVERPICSRCDAAENGFKS
jgi:hypothetical protein